MAEKSESYDLYALPGLRHGAPKAGFPEPEMLPQVAYEIVHDELMLDGVSRMNLATFCTTWVDDQARRLMNDSIDKNIVDKDEYPQTAELERRAVRMVADLWHAPDPATALGTSTTGSSEAAMLGGLAAKVPTFGQTFTGLFEHVAGISRALDEIQTRTGLDIPIHVDAASGGFLAPFCAPDLEWDFRLPRVKSINASGHKTGLAPLGAGWAIWREAADLPAELIFDVDYLGGSMATFNLNFSRPGGQVITQYYDFIRLGRTGYRRVQQQIYRVARHLAAGVRDLGHFELIHDGDPRRGITAVSWTLRDGDPGFNLYDLSDRLRTRGWLIAAYPLPADREHETIMRAVLRHGFSVDMIDLLLADMGRGIAQLRANPRSTPLTRADVGGFTHSATAAVPTSNTRGSGSKR
ncbi:pyridoxal-dependent decarboxylase [Nocardia otitidiscaviarum]|uniref:pyridoxal-dependent decarboxylase n=1 Tax=Nocardia otitidiscaviarum TaxID=1823 RepID=UPI0018952A87|nr:pyridoxal-dependent decarboxylase [Nocardia otitidiscaviarum]MBF6179321.1 glutamate decarboxylase [Nocardia otitidiscaviarum]